MSKFKTTKDFTGQSIYNVEISSWNTSIEVYDWLVNNFGGYEKGQCSFFLSPDKYWAIYYTTYGTIQLKFRNEAHANWFILRWL